MSTPHTCPVCNGRGKIDTTPVTATAVNYCTCPACNGTCVVWEPMLDADVEWKAKPTCPMCAGSGHMRYGAGDGEFVEACTACKGNGLDRRVLFDRRIDPNGKPAKDDPRRGMISNCCSQRIKANRRKITEASRSSHINPHVQMHNGDG